MNHPDTELEAFNRPIAYWLGWDSHARGDLWDETTAPEFQRGWTDRATAGVDIYDTKAITAAEWRQSAGEFLAAGWAPYHTALGVVYLRQPYKQKETA